MTKNRPADATTFVAKVLKNGGLKTSNRYHCLRDIIQYNRKQLKYDTIVQTPGGGFCRNISLLYFNKASNEAIKREFGNRKYVLAELLVDGEIRPVLQESENGNIKFRFRPASTCKQCGKKVNSDQYQIRLNKKDAAVFSRLLQSKLHPNSPKFQLRIVDKRSTDGKLWLVFESAERCRV
jgi:hypothetical protein